MKRFLLLTLLAFNLINLKSQDYEIIYSAYSRQKFNEKETKEFENKPQGREQLKANEEPPSETYKMIISGNESSFNYQDRISNNQGQIFDIRYPVAGMGTTYHNLKDSIQMKDMGEIYGKIYHSLDSLQNLKWTITKEKREILGFQVRKATTFDKEGSSIIAWYAPKLSIPNGPGDYWGLPGLILELEKNYNNERNRKDFYIIQSIKEIKSPKIIKPSKGIQIKESDLDAIYKEGQERLKKIESENIEKD